jgi:hypothetical protein
MRELQMNPSQLKNATSVWSVCGQAGSTRMQCKQLTGDAHVLCHSSSFKEIRERLQLCGMLERCQHSMPYRMSDLVQHEVGHVQAVP